MPDPETVTTPPPPPSPPSSSPQPGTLRVLHVTSGIEPEAGGPTTALIGLTRALARCSIDVSVLATWERESAFAAAATLNAAGVATRLVGPATRPGIRHPDIEPALRTAMGTADVVHIHAVWDEVQHRAARIARGAAIPYVVTPHGMLSEWSLAQGRLKKRIYLALRLRNHLRHAAALHFTTSAERDSAARLKLGVPTFIEPLGLDFREFDATVVRPDHFRRRFPQLGSHPFVLFLGRIKRGKGLELLLPAFARISAGVNARLVIAGPDADFREAADKLIAGHALNDRVIFTGMLRDADHLAALREAYVLALPSFHENFGMVVVEAMAAGTPVIVSDQVNIHGDVTAGGVGAVVPTSVEPLAAELSRWLGDPALRDGAAGRCKPFARARYDWAVIARNWERHYRRLASRQPLTTAAAANAGDAGRLT